MLSLLKNDKPFVLFIIPVLAAGIWFLQLLDPSFNQLPYNQAPMPLYASFLQIINPLSTYALAANIILLLINVYQVTQINARYKLIDQGTFLPGIVYLLFASSYAPLREFNPLFIANGFFLFAIHRLFSTYKAGPNLAPFFEAGFLVAVGSLFYFPLILFSLIVFTTLASLRNFRWREYVAVIFGLITPFYLFLAYAYFFHNGTDIFQLISSNIVTKAHAFAQPYALWGFIGFSSFLLLIGIGFSFSGVVKKVNARKYYNAFILLSFLCAAVFALVPAASVEILVILAAPLAFFFSNHLIKMQSAVLAELVFLAFLGGLISLQFLA